MAAAAWPAIGGFDPRLPGAGFRRRRQATMRIDRSIARTCLVSDPTEM